MRNKKIKMKKISSIILCLLLTALIPAQVFSAEAINPNKNASLFIDYIYDGAPLSDAQFDVYMVATVSAYTEFTLTSSFVEYPICVDGLDISGWNELALTLKGYVQADEIAPLAEGKTDENGALAFDMKPGLYLVVGKGIVKDTYSYTCAPFMVCLPGMDMENNMWNYDVTVSPKAQRDKDYDPLDSPTVTRKVLKVWEDHGYTDEIPSEVKVTLYCDGEIYGTVSLNKEENWRYSWEELERGHEWTVVEEKVEGYTVKITQEGQTFVVTNTNEKPMKISDSSYSGNLPQTGVLWWPIFIMLLVGVLLLAVGLWGRRRNNDA